MAEAAALATVVRILSPLICKLVNKVSHFHGRNSIKKLKALETEFLPKIQAVIKAAETTWVDGLEPWLRELKEAALEAENILDEYEYNLLKEKVKSHQVSDVHYNLLCPSAVALNKIAKKGKGIVSAVSLKSKLSNCVNRLEKIATRVDFFFSLLSITNVIKKLKVGTGDEMEGEPMTPHPPSSQMPSAVFGRAVFGRDDERNSLIKLLISQGKHETECSSSNWRVPIIAIYGLGGAGKTTLAQYICNDQRVTEHFDRQMWVHVSCKFDVFAIVKEMIESAARGSIQHNSNLDTLLTKLKDNLKATKFLLVLDDVWRNKPIDRPQYWDHLINALTEVGDRRSRVLMTTRMEGVASLLGAEDCISLKELKSGDCLSIIEHYALGGLKFADFPELLEVGKQIVHELKGSLLTARMVASNQLKRKLNVDAWRRILEGGLLNSTMDVLLSSFKHLPAHVQQCFAFCSLFPKGKKLRHDELVHL